MTAGTGDSPQMPRVSGERVGRQRSAAMARSRSAAPDRLLRQWPTLAIRPLLTSSRFLRGGAMNPLEVCGAETAAPFQRPGRRRALSWVAPAAAPARTPWKSIWG